MKDDKMTGTIDLNRFRHANMIHEIEKRTKAFKDSGCESIVIKNSKSIDKKHILSIITKIREHDISDISLLCDARRFSEKGFVRRLKESGLTKAYIKVNNLSLTGQDKELQILDGSRNLANEGIDISTIISIKRSNHMNINNILDEFWKIGSREAYIRFPNKVEPDKNVRYSEICEKIDDLITEFEGKMDLRLINFPYCIMKRPDKNLRYHTHMFRTIFDSTNNITKLTDCRYCRYSMICNGISRSYLEVFGEDEFKHIDGLKISPDMLPDNGRSVNEEFTKNRLELNIGLACNNDCVFCISGKKSKKLDPAEKIIEEIDKYKGRGIDLLNILGGEPTLVKQLPDVIEHAKEVGFNNIHIITNGRRLKDYGFAKALIENGLNRISITIHGHNKEIQDATVQREGAFEETIQGIGNIARIKEETGKDVKLTSGTCITKMNYKHLKDTVKNVIDKGIEEVLFINLNPMGNCTENLEGIIPKYSDVRPRLKEAAEYCKSRGVGVAFDGFAHCVINDITEFQEEDFDQKDEVTSYDVEETERIQFDWIDERKSLKMKSEACKECILNYKCEGIWKAYVELYGYSDFKPIKR
ncbi:MAG: radical SAM protein [Candidatus Woesearchaeota archaeon]